jgi:choline kinase
VSAAHVSAVLSSVRRGEACVLATARPGGTGLDLEDATKVLADDDGQIRQIGKELKRYNQIDTGVFSMTRALFPALARAAADGDHSLTGGNRGLAAQGLLFAQPIGDLPWQDVDTPEDLLAAECLAERFLRCGPRV